MTTDRFNPGSTLTGEPIPQQEQEAQARAEAQRQAVVRENQARAAAETQRVNSQEQEEYEAHVRAREQRRRERENKKRIAENKAGEGKQKEAELAREDQGRVVGVKPKEEPKPTTAPGKDVSAQARFRAGEGAVYAADKKAAEEAKGREILGKVSQRIKNEPIGTYPAQPGEKAQMFIHGQYQGSDTSIAAHQDWAQWKEVGISYVPFYSDARGWKDASNAERTIGLVTSVLTVAPALGAVGKAAKGAVVAGRGVRADAVTMKSLARLESQSARDMDVVLKLQERKTGVPGLADGYRDVSKAQVDLVKNLDAEAKLEQDLSSIRQVEPGAAENVAQTRKMAQEKLDAARTQTKLSEDRLRNAAGRYQKTVKETFKDLPVSDREMQPRPPGAEVTSKAGTSDPRAMKTMIDSLDGDALVRNTREIYAQTRNTGTNVAELQADVDAAAARLAEAQAKHPSSPTHWTDRLEELNIARAKLAAARAGSVERIAGEYRAMKENIRQLEAAREAGRAPEEPIAIDGKYKSIKDLPAAREELEASRAKLRDALNAMEREAGPGAEGISRGRGGTAVGTRGGTIKPSTGRRGLKAIPVPKLTRAVSTSEVPQSGGAVEEMPSIETRSTPKPETAPGIENQPNIRPGRLPKPTHKTLSSPGIQPEPIHSTKPSHLRQPGHEVEINPIVTPEPQPETQPKTPTPTPPRPAFPTTDTGTRARPIAPFRLPSGESMKSGEFPREVSWVQGDARVFRDLDTGETRFEAYRGKSVTPRDSFKVTRTDSTPPEAQRLYLGMVDVLIDAKSLKFEAHPERREFRDTQLKNRRRMANPFRRRGGL